MISAVLDQSLCHFRQMASFRQ